MRKLAPYQLERSKNTYRPMASRHRDQDPWLLASGALVLMHPEEDRMPRFGS
jgi:hypothetical protein